jgi:recombination protein RecT
MTTETYTAQDQTPPAPPAPNGKASGGKTKALTTESMASAFLKQHQPSLERYAVRQYDADTFIRSAHIAILESAELQKCLETDDGRLSVYHALRFAASTGLSLNPQLGQAALIAYKGKCTYQIMKNGLIELAMSSGQVETLISDVVRDNDEFRLTRSNEGDRYEFSPSLKDRGDVIGYFAAARLTSGPTIVKYMSIDEVNEVRDGYSAMYKFNKNNSPWTHSPIGMGLKTVIKALLKNLNMPTIAAIDAADSVQLTADETGTYRRQKGSSAAEIADKLKPTGGENG